MRTIQSEYIDQFEEQQRKQNSKLMKSITGRTQRNNYFVNGLSTALKQHEQTMKSEYTKLQQQKAEQELKKKKPSNFNADIEIYNQTNPLNAEDSFAETPLNITKSPKKANK